MGAGFSDENLFHPCTFENGLYGAAGFEALIKAALKTAVIIASWPVF